MPNCACGCGQEIAEGKRFAHGHWSKTPEARAMYAARRGPVDNPSGLCQCGCGGATNRGKRFLAGHAIRGKRLENHPRWKGGRFIHRGGYVYVYRPDHPRANAAGYVYEHRLVAETTLGRHLTARERVHHINGDKTDNRPENLVVLASQAEHVRLRDHGTDVLRRENAQQTRADKVRAGRLGAEARWGKHQPPNPPPPGGERRTDC
jgi:hypothetical protein